MKKLYILLVAFVCSYGFPYYSLYEPNGFTDLSLNMIKPCPKNEYAGVQKGDYCLYRSFGFLASRQDFMIFLPSGIKAYEINVIRVGSSGTISGVLSMDPAEDYTHADLYNAVDGTVKNRYEGEKSNNNIALTMLLDNKKLVYPNVGAIGISAYNIPKNIYQNLDKWIFFDVRNANELITRGLTRSLLPQTGAGGGFAVDDLSSLYKPQNDSSKTSGFYFADLKFGMKYYFDKEYVDEYVESRNLSGCEEFNETIRNLCLYLRDKYKDVLFRVKKDEVDVQKFELYTEDPVTNQMLRNAPKEQDNLSQSSGDLETKIDGKQEENNSSATDRSLTSIEKQLITKHTYPIKGYWIQYGDGVFDWVYIQKRSTGEYRAFKLKGPSKDGQRLEWQNLDKVKINISNGKIIFE